MTRCESLRLDHVGSLLRPHNLQEIALRCRQGKATAAELKAAQDDAVRTVIRKQEEHGLPVLSDGEYRRYGFTDGTVSSLAGLGPFMEMSTQRFLAENERRPDSQFTPSLSDAPAATEPLRLAHNVPLDEYRFAAGLTSFPVKITLTSPQRLSQNVDPHAGPYASLEAVMSDGAAAVHDIAAEVAAAGCPYIQIDAPGYTSFIDADRRAWLESRGVNLEQTLSAAIRAECDVVAGIAGDVTFGMHICRGNRVGSKHGVGSYEAVAEQLFNGVPHHRLLLEYDTDRAGGFEPLRFVPKHKVAVLGLVSTKSAEMERVDTLKRRIDEAARYLPLDQLAISPQCGFSSSVSGHPLNENEQWRKVDLLRQLAFDVWGTT